MSSTRSQKLKGSSPLGSFVSTTESVVDNAVVRAAMVGIIAVAAVGAIKGENPFNLQTLAVGAVTGLGLFVVDNFAPKVTSKGAKS